MNCDLKCRTCLKEFVEKSDTVPIRLKNETICNLTIADLIMECSSIKILINDGLPQCICRDCILRLRQAYEFKLLVENSDQILRTELNSKDYFNWESTLDNRIDNNYDNNEEFNEQMFIGNFEKFFKKQESNSDCPKKSKRILTNCDLCGLKVNLKRYKRHILAKHPVLECCKIKLKNINALMRHRWKFHLGKKAQEPKRHNCTICERNFAQINCLRRHMVVAHNASPDLIKKKIRLCQICGYSTPAACALTRHMRIHTGEKPYMCTYDNCTKRFTDGTGLKYHIRFKHSNIKDYHCDVCGQSYHTSSNLTKHKRDVHSNVRNYCCKICAKSFAHKRSLDVHITAKHTDTKFNCEFCNREFSYQKDLSLHKRIHIVQLPFKCQNCGKGFLQECGLKSHLTMSACVGKIIINGMQNNVLMST